MTSISNSEAIANINKVQPAALAINLGTNVALSLITLGAFCWLRPKNGVIYARKYKTSPEDKRAPRLDGGYFSWMGPVWSCPDDELVHKIGLDAVVFIRFVRMCRQVAMAMAVIGIGVLIPINVVSTIRAQKDGKAPLDKISLLTMAGIEDLNFLWAHVAAMWCFSGIMVFAMYHGYKTFLKYRIQYFESEAYQENMASRTLMLLGLPSALQNDEKLSKFMSDLGMREKPVQALVGRKVDKLPELMENHKKMVTSLEKVLAKYFADPQNLPEKRPTVRMGGICGTKVDAIDYYSQQIEELADQIERARAELSKSQPTNYGFVSYGTIQAAHRVAKTLSNSLVYHTKAKMLDPPEVFLSPVPKDIIWFNASNPKQLRKSRKVIVNALFFVGSLLFFIPMGSLTMLAKLDRIIGLFPSTKTYFEENTFVASLVQSLLPVLIMDILFMLIRKLIVYLAWFQGNVTKSSTDRSTLSKFYLFFTLNNLIVFALSSTIIGFFAQIKIILASFSFSLDTWNMIRDFMRDQSSIVDLLSKNVIDTSLFWVNYISLRNFSALLDLFQLVSLFLYWLKTTVTPRESQKMDKPAVFDFPLFFSAHMFLLTVTLLYSVVAPLVLFFAVVYFSLASLVYKYQLMYVFRTKIETGGRLFRVVYNRLLAALILFQIVMIGVLNLKKAHKHSVAVLPLPLITILFKLFLARHYDPKIDYYDYGSARQEKHLSSTGKKDKSNTLSMNFENPVFRSKAIVALVPDGAKKMLSSKVLNGGRDFSPVAKPKSVSKKKSFGKQGSMATVDASPYKEQQSENFEMRHIPKSQKSVGQFQILGADPYNTNENDYSPSRTQSQRQPQKRYDNQSQYTLGGTDDPLDDYFDDQKQSLTKSASQRYNDSLHQQQQGGHAAASQPKVYGAQDMTSFVAGRYRADQTTDQYSYSNNSRYKSRAGSNNNSGSSNDNSTGSEAKPSTLEWAKMHQTDSFKTSGKATTYEDARNKFQVPNVNYQIPKAHFSNPRKVTSKDPELQQQWQSRP
ncbi:hypothetical protein BGZ51_009231 [Haplosporangium sp. Z 767]|nr:hypothetical protein BGZ51_009231 [Haplosporangium sp. Z 767]